MTERGPIQTYEVTFRHGHVDRVDAHQVAQHGGPSFFNPQGDGPERVQFHGEIDGQWMLLLDVLRDDVLSVRNVTQLGDPLESS